MLRQPMMFSKRGTSAADVDAAIVAATPDAAAYPWVESYPVAIGTNLIAWGSANVAYLMRVPRRTKRLTTNKIAVVIGTASGNIDVGVYMASGTSGTLTRVASTGSTAAAGTNAVQELSLAMTWEANTDYWLAVAADNTTVTMGGFNPGSGTISGAVLSRMVQKGSSFPLPSSLSSLATTFGTNRWVIAYNPE